MTFKIYFYKLDIKDKQIHMNISCKLVTFMKNKIWFDLGP